MYVRVCVYVCACGGLCLFNCLVMRMCMWVSVCLCVCLDELISVFPSVCDCVQMLVCCFVCLSVRLFV